MVKNCWTCKYLLDWASANFVQDFKCNWFKVKKGLDPKLIWPKKDPDDECKLCEQRIKED